MADLIPEQRRQYILDQLRKQYVLSITELVELLSCSHMTIRRDIAHLEQKGKVVSVSGGVCLKGNLNVQPSHQQKVGVDSQEKEAIARAAARHLHGNMTVFLDAGTTTQALVPYLKQLDNITVVTNDFTICQSLIDSSIKVIHTGGCLDHANRSSVGHLAVAVLKLLVMDVAFISTSSWNADYGITTPSTEKVGLKRQAMNSASYSILMATSAKFGSYGRFRIANLSEFDKIITDKKMTEENIISLKELSVPFELG